MVIRVKKPARRSIVAGVGAVAVLTGGLLAPTAAQAATVTVWREAPVCAVARVGHASCDAVRLVARLVPANSPAAAQGIVRPTAGAGPAGGYTPAQIAKAYGVNANAKTGLTVGIVDAYSSTSLKSDVNFFDKHYGLPQETAQSFKVVNQSGNASPLPNPDSNWAGEITLDVEAVRGMCHKCKIVLVETNSNSFTDLAAGVDTAVKAGAKIVSNSYGGTETAGNPTTAKSYDHKKVAILASTGDHGFYDWDWVNGGTGTPSGTSAVPASYPTVVGVGGTSLYLNPNNSRAGEQVWNTDGPSDVYGNPSFGFGNALGAAGSGCSAKYAAPSWQKQVKGYSSLGCKSGKRSEVDIAAIADPATGYDIYQTYPNTSGSWQTYGGTSLASPVLAGIWADAGGPGSVSYPASTLYANFKKNPKVSYDVTIGGTGFCSTSSPKSCASEFGVSPNKLTGGTYPDLDCAFKPNSATVLPHRSQCYAVPGFDGVSGVGTPKGPGLFKH